LAFRLTPEALRWVQGLARHVGLDCTSLLWQSLLRTAEASGYYVTIPRRYEAKLKPDPHARGQRRAV
jgi:hypothetical protein